LSADRANAIRQILDAEGVPSGNIFMVAGNADTDPLFPDDPSMSPNRRVTITLMREELSLPADLSPKDTRKTFSQSRPTDKIRPVFPGLVR